MVSKVPSTGICVFWFCLKIVMFMMQEDHFPFVYCVEKLVYERKYPEWESCFEELGLDPKRVSECYTGGYGNEVSLLLDLLCF